MASRTVTWPQVMALSIGGPRYEHLRTAEVEFDVSVPADECAGEVDLHFIEPTGYGYSGQDPKTVERRKRALDPTFEWEPLRLAATTGVSVWQYASPHGLGSIRKAATGYRWQRMSRRPAPGVRNGVIAWAAGLGRPFSVKELRAEWKRLGGGKRNMWDLVQRMPLDMVHDHSGRGWSGMDARNIYEYSDAQAANPTSHLASYNTIGPADRTDLCPVCTKKGGTP